MVSVFLNYGENWCSYVSCKHTESAFPPLPIYFDQSGSSLCNNKPKADCFLVLIRTVQIIKWGFPKAVTWISYMKLGFCLDERWNIHGWMMNKKIQAIQQTSYWTCDPSTRSMDKTEFSKITGIKDRVLCLATCSPWGGSEQCGDRDSKPYLFGDENHT